MQDAAALAAKLRQMAAADKVTPAALAALVVDVFTHCGVPRADAEIGAEVALWAQTARFGFARRRAFAALYARSP